MTAGRELRAGGGPTPVQVERYHREPAERVQGEEIAPTAVECPACHAVMMWNYSIGKCDFCSQWGRIPPEER